MIRRLIPAILPTLAVLSGPALAYYPCNGPGPDEVLVGVDPGGNGVAPTPLCEYVGPPDGEPGYDEGVAPGGYWVDRYAVLVWGNEAGGAPTYTWTVDADSQAGAEASALNHCVASGFQDCRVATWVVNGAIAVVVDASGSLWSDQGADAKEAKRKAVAACKAQGGRKCKVEKVLESLPVWVGN